MKKNFTEWYAVRHNIHPILGKDAIILDEGFWGNVAKGAGIGAGAGGLAGTVFPGVGTALGALGGGLVGGLGAGVAPWIKQKGAQISNAANKAWNAPSGPDDETNKSIQNAVEKFATRLGLGNVTDPTIVSALKNILVARAYGQKYGDIYFGDLNIVWQAMQKPSQQDPNKTIAQAAGIDRPLRIITYVPGITPGVKYGVEPDVIRFDKQWAANAKQAARQPVSGPPTPASPVPGPPTTPASPVPGSPAPLVPPVPAPERKSPKLSKANKQYSMKIVMADLKNNGIIDELSNSGINFEEPKSLKSLKLQLEKIINEKILRGKHLQHVKSALKYLQSIIP